MSIFASRTVKTVDIPFDLPHTVTIQVLPGRHLARAKQVFFNKMIAEVQERGGATVQKDIQTLFEKDPDGTKEAVAKVQADPLNGYDPETLVQFGVKGWSYEGPADEAAFKDLREEVIEFFAREVLKLTKPALFRTEAEQEADQKNG